MEFIEKFFCWLNLHRWRNGCSQCYPCNGTEYIQCLDCGLQQKYVKVKK